mgnify:CR=1 FL=1
MKKFLLSVLICLPLLAKAQTDEKYLAGAIPVVVGKVSFTTEMQVPALSQEQLYDALLDWANTYFKPEGKLNARVLYTNKEEGTIAAGGEEYLVFTSSALSLDRTRIYYQLLMTCKPGKCDLEMTRIRYWYDEARDGGEKYVAEEWITDDMALNKSKTKLAPIVSSARAAKLLCQKWFAEYKYIPDAIVVEGPKAGGHLGYKEEQLVDEHYALESIVPEIVAEVHAFEAEHGCHIPVIAGGGIYTGEDIYRIMSLGAEGVQMGTRFVTTEECDADPAFKQSYLDATQQDIEIIKSPVGMPGRAIHSSFLDRVKEGLKRPKNCPFDCIKTCDVTHSPYCIMLALYNAFKGKLQNGYAFCGANAWRAEKIQSVRDLMASLKAEYDNFSLKGKLFGVK